MESFAAAILSALAAGAANIAKEAVGDVYSSAKRTLSRLVPNFDVEKAAHSDPHEVEAELSTRLGGLIEAERVELLAEFRKLADVVELEDVAKVLGDTVELTNLNSDDDMQIEIDNTDSGTFVAQSLTSGGKLTIKKTVRSVE